MEETRLVPISALQHFAFCPRQCALIHTEQVWADNFLTAQGNLLHERVDSGEPESRRGTRFERGVYVSAPQIGLVGKLDLVERELDTGKLLPVEYKRGRPKPSDWDEIQLCAQALCLEEMTAQTIEQGALWYYQTRRRLPIIFTEALRNRTISVVNDVISLLSSGHTPSAVYGKHCHSCSLFDLCSPKLMQSDSSIAHMRRLYSLDSLNEETSK